MIQKIFRQLLWLPLCVLFLVLLLPDLPAMSAEPFDVETKLAASDAAEGDSFGGSVAISGNTIIVGADGDGDCCSGSAYLFDATTGNQLFKLTADVTTKAFFGSSVAISGNTAIVGAWGNAYAAGSAYLFDVTTGNQLFELTASDARTGRCRHFGYFVAISGNMAIVGAMSCDDDGSNVSRSVYVFDVTTGNQLFKLTASDTAWRDRFGMSVGISGNTAIVGAVCSWIRESDSAYLFDVTTGNQLLKLTASDATANDFFGDSVAISGNRAIVGAHNGSVYPFTPEP